MLKKVDLPRDRSPVVSLREGGERVRLREGCKRGKLVRREKGGACIVLVDLLRAVFLQPVALD